MMSDPGGGSSSSLSRLLALSEVNQSASSMMPMRRLPMSGLSDISWQKPS
jgi:hypothetical protein